MVKYLLIEDRNERGKQGTGVRSSFVLDRGKNKIWGTQEVMGKVTESSNPGMVWVGKTLRTMQL